MATLKSRWTFGAEALTLGLTLVGCGGLLGEEAKDEALLTVEGSLIVTAPLEDAQAKKLRAALLWEHYPQATLECLESSAATGSAYYRCMRKSPKLQFEQRAADVKVPASSFPATFRMPVTKLPEPTVLHGEEGSRLGFAYVLAYVDGNDNKQLDSVSLTATSSPDTVVGHQEGHTAGALAYHWVIYREGALRPLYAKLFPDCEEPPQGYSVVTFRYSNIPGSDLQNFEGCFVQQGRVELDMTLDPNHKGFQQLACEEPNTLMISEWVRPTQPPPAGSDQQCYRFRNLERDMVLLVNPHPERFCTVGNTQAYALRDIWEQQWDDRATPPSWWPCEVMPAP